MSAEPRLVRSRDNAQVKQLLRLATSSRERRRTGATLLDGAHLVDAYAQSGGIAEVLAASETAYADPSVRALFERVRARVSLLLSDALIARVSQVVTSSGILAVVRTPEPEPMPEVIGNCIVLDGIQDPGNLGSILRSTVAAGVRHVFLAPGSVFAWAPKVVRAGQGAHFFLSIYEDVALDRLAQRLRGRLVATDARVQRSLFECDLRGPIAWLFGNEGAGISAAAARLAVETVSVPMPGKAESLNVAAAAAICLFEQVRQTAFPRPDPLPKGEGATPLFRREKGRG